MRPPGKRLVWFVGPISMFAVSCARPPSPVEEPVVVRVVHAKAGETTSAFRASGDVHARVEESVAFRTSGKVVARLVDVGDRVKAGTLLARLDPQQPRADLAVAAATVAAARSSLARAVIERDRQHGLLAKDATSQAAVDDADREALVVESRLAAAKARYEMAREAVADTELRAVRAGVVTARSVELGQPATQGATAFMLADDGPREAVFRVDENVARLVHKGTAFTVESADDARIRISGTVRELAPVLEKGTASVRVKVALEGALPVEMALGTAVVASLAQPSRGAFSLPSSSVFADPREDPSVWIYDPVTHAVTLRKVVVQAYEAGSVTLRSGLQDGELVVTAGASRLRPAQVVRLANGEAS